MARRAVSFNASILYFDPFRIAATAVPAQRLDTLERLLAESDIVTIDAPATPQNRHLINEKALRHMLSMLFS